MEPKSEKRKNSTTRKEKIAIAKTRTKTVHFYVDWDLKAALGYYAQSKMFRSLQEALAFIKENGLENSAKLARIIVTEYHNNMFRGFRNEKVLNIAAAFRGDYTLTENPGIKENLS